jgi:hypothetical protein
MRGSFQNLDEERLSLMKKSLSKLAKVEEKLYKDLNTHMAQYCSSYNDKNKVLVLRDLTAATYEEYLTTTDSSIKMIKVLGDVLHKVSSLQEAIGTKYHKHAKSASSNLLFVEGPTFQRAWLKVLSYFEYQSKMRLEMATNLKEHYALVFSSTASELQAKRRSIDIALGNSLKAKAAEQKRLDAADSKYTKACSALKAVEYDLSKEIEDQSMLNSPVPSPGKQLLTATQPAISLKSIGKLLGQPQVSGDTKIQLLHDQVKAKKIAVEETKDELKICQMNLKVADQAHHSLVTVIQDELKVSLTRAVDQVNTKLIEMMHFYHQKLMKIGMEQQEIGKIVDMINNDEDILDYSRENQSELNLTVEVIPLPDKIKSELNSEDAPVDSKDKVSTSPPQGLAMLKFPTNKEPPAPERKMGTYDVKFSGKNLSIKFRRQGEKLIVRKLLDDENAECGQVRLGSEVVAIDGGSVAGLTGDEVIEKIKNNPRPIVITFSARRMITPRRTPRMTGTKIFDKDTALPVAMLSPNSARIKQKAENLSAEDVTFQVTFGLPAEEVVVASFSCAFYPSSFPHQGRLEISKHFVGFHATWGGNCHPRLIALKDIITIDRKHTVSLFPNAIRLQTKNNKTYFFGNFIFRDKAFEVIQKMSGAKTSEEDVPSTSTSPVSSPVSRKASVSVSEGAKESAAPPSTYPGDLGDGYSSENEVDGTEVMEGKSLLESWKILGECDFDLGVKHAKYMFWSDDNKYTETLGLKHSGEKDYVNEPWKEETVTFKGESYTHHRKIACLRSVNIFGSIRMGRVNQFQYYRFEGSNGRDRFIITTQNEVMDLPYSDCFKVSTKWVFHRLPRSASGVSRCRLTLGIMIDMLKTGFLVPESIIKSEATSQTESFYKVFIKTGHEQIKKQRAVIAQRRANPQAVSANSQEKTESESAPAVADSSTNDAKAEEVSDNKSTAPQEGILNNNKVLWLFLAIMMYYVWSLSSRVAALEAHIANFQRDGR